MSGFSMIALTDYEWYKTLSQYATFEEVNFWTPTPWNIQKLKYGETVYLLLKEKYGRTICGYGNFKEYKNMPLETAWEQYGILNGTKNLAEMRKRVSEYTTKNSKIGFTGKGHIIGCIILTNLQFIDTEEQHEASYYGWNIPKQVVKYKYVMTDHSERLNEFIQLEENHTSFSLVNDTKRRRNVSAAERKGQNKFRNLIIKAYYGKCCITEDNTTPILQAAHIQNYISEFSNHIQNGLLLRIDLHSLFDAGLITIDEKYTVHASSHLLSPYYKEFEGKKIFLPVKNERPSVEALKWHNDNVFRP